MHIIKKPRWQLSQAEVTDEALFHKRRDFLKLGAAALVSSSVVMDTLLAAQNNPLSPLAFTPTPYGKGLELSTFEQASTYNNFYEFSTAKEKPARMAHTLRLSPWEVGFHGECENTAPLEVSALLARLPLEERIYRFRCVEGWSMVVPWIGFPLSALLAIAKPTSKAKYVLFQTKYDPTMFPDQRKGMRQGVIPYPYVEGLRMDEAMHPLAFVAVGMYGKVLPNQNGAPLRLIVPWKYGFKSIKSIDHVAFTTTEPKNTWQALNPREYGFYANVNPHVDHPRWSQAKERKLGSFLKTETLMFNGYGEEVASLYKEMDLKRFF
ncbi:MAG: protein-methionine-sulfoxide reductase catalytic subunit MsrP [Campylobacterales bacterium]|nr:protein-methionine-sulfoxide reductase catalytic subunit MsrP [Campylobacterales bacterium]